MPWILLVDDDAEIRAITAELLTSEGYEVVEAGDGMQALRALITTPQRPALVLLDLMMPKMRGEALLEVLREMGRLHELDIVAVTAGTTKSVSGARGVLHKPFSLAELLDVAAQYCTPTAPRSGRAQ